ncbi:MAG: nuclear transport factor 2 family protein [Alphaproteobacteria bacterium]
MITHRRSEPLYRPYLKLVSDNSSVKAMVSLHYGARVDGDAELFSRCFTPDGALTILGDRRMLPQAGRHVGRAAIRNIVSAMASDLDCLDAFLVDVIAEGDRGVVHWHMTLRGATTGSIADFDVADHLILRDGLVASATEFIDTTSLGLLAGRI